MDFDLMISSFPKLLNATLITLKLLSVSLIVGLILGILFSIMRINKNPIINKLAYGYYQRFDNVFTGPGKVKGGKIEPLPRKQSIEELTENLMICPVNEMIDKLSVSAEAGVDEIIISAGFGQSQNEIIESMHRISEDVIPYFKKFNTQVA